ncbi:MAG: pyridoxamine 5'-phosphate oxidase family protein [Oscillospiraceae bacterium]|nr:pyridoxamine 5'-phosphate oxidase family protein [Oscillospiraceae bacterium]
MKEAYDFLKKCGTYYIATAQGDQPRVRPFGTADIFDGKLYIQTGKKKPCSAQMAANPKIELCAFNGAEGAWLRIAAVAVNDDRREAKAHMLDAHPQLKDMGYSPDDDNTQVLYLKDAEATFSSFTAEPRTVRF